ncbi:MAG: glycosyl hydrolase [Candidatus Omnitrophota bacterium]
MKTAHCEIGAFVGNPNSRPPTSQEIREFEQLIGRHLSSVLFFWAWDDGDFPAPALKDVRDHDGYDTGIKLQITWEPWRRAGADDNSYTLRSIINRQHDAYISRFARACRDWKDIIRLRFAHEMIHYNNPEVLGWFPWQDKPDEYVPAWNHIHNIFKNEHADNVEFVWAPQNYPPWFDALEKYYPGQDKVDWLGIDGYNWGEDGLPGWPYDQNFTDLFYPLYHAFVDHPKVFGDKKIMISEIATPKDNQFGGHKSAWILDMFECLKNEYAKVEAFYWFNAEKEKDWRVNSSAQSLDAFKNGLRDPYFTSHTVPKT